MRVAALIAAAALTGCASGRLGGIDVVDDPDGAAFLRCVWASAAGSFTNTEGEVVKITFDELPEGYTVELGDGTCKLLPPAE